MNLLSHVRLINKKYLKRINAEKSEALLLVTNRNEAAKLHQAEKELFDKQQQMKLDEKEKEVKKNESELKGITNF